MVFALPGEAATQRRWMSRRKGLDSATLSAGEIGRTEKGSCLGNEIAAFARNGCVGEGVGVGVGLDPKYVKSPWSSISAREMLEP